MAQIGIQESAVESRVGEQGQDTADESRFAGDSLDSKTPYYADERVRVFGGDCLAVMPSLDAESFDAVITDPPYHLVETTKRFANEAAERKMTGQPGVYKRHSRGFMGQKWDGGDIAFRPETWAAAYRLLKPGGHLIAFGGSRTWHRIASAIDEAGFEIRDSLVWLYGSGFPKSHDVSKGLDKLARRDYVLAAQRLGMEIPGRNLTDWTKEDHSPGDAWWEQFKAVLSADDWQRIEREVVGWAHRKNDRDAVSIRLGRKSDDFAVTVSATDAAKQWDGWGTALKPAMELICLARKPLRGTVAQNVQRYGVGAINVDGCRVETDEVGAPREVARREDRENWRITGGSNGSGATSPAGRWPANVCVDERVAGEREEFRYFYTAKASQAERQGVTHPTVKPVSLMRWLCRLVTPPNGHILDPFAGTGTTRLATLAEGFRVTLIEKNPEYLEQLCGRHAKMALGLTA